MNVSDGTHAICKISFCLFFYEFIFSSLVDFVFLHKVVKSNDKIIKVNWILLMTQFKDVSAKIILR